MPTDSCVSTFSNPFKMEDRCANALFAFFSRRTGLAISTWASFSATCRMRRTASSAAAATSRLAARCVASGLPWPSRSAKRLGPWPVWSRRGGKGKQRKAEIWRNKWQIRLVMEQAAESRLQMYAKDSCLTSSALGYIPYSHRVWERSEVIPFDMCIYGQTMKHCICTSPVTHGLLREQVSSSP